MKTKLAPATQIKTLKSQVKALQVRNAKLLDALKIIAAHTPERGTALETVVMFAMMTLDEERQ